MKSFILLLAVLFLLMTGVVQAQEDAATASATDSIDSIFTGGEFNLSTDFLRDWKDGTNLLGLGLPLAEYREGIAEIKLEMATNFDEDTLYGLGVGVDPLKLMKVTPYLKDWEWTAKITFKLSFLTMIDFDDTDCKGIKCIHPVTSVQIVKLF